MRLIMNKIALLKGGLNSENEVSLKTAEACLFALRELKYEIVEIDIKDQFISKIIDSAPTSSASLIDLSIYGGKPRSIVPSIGT